MTRHDLDYLHRRLREEREAAERSVDADAKRAHVDLADAYQCRITKASTPVGA